MRTLLYFRTHFDDAANQGVTEKCQALAEAFGSSATYWHFSKQGMMEGTNRSKSVYWNMPKRSWRHIFFYFFVADVALVRRVDFRQYSMFYIRHTPAHPFFLALLWWAKKQHPSLKIVLEIATWPYDQEGQAGWAAYLDRWCRPMLKRYVDYIVHYGHEPEIMGIPTIRLTNGIAVTKRRLAQTTPAHDSTIRILAVGNWSYWQGLDRLLHGMSAHQRSGRKARLDIVGGGSELPSLRALVHQLDLEQSVTFHPPKASDDLDLFFDQADIGFGVCGLRRKGLKTASPLKHREYISRGLPFVMAGIDDDLDQNWPFAHQVRADDTAIDITQIEAFLAKLYAEEPSYSAKMREFAEENLSWEKRVQTILHRIGLGA